MDLHVHSIPGSIAADPGFFRKVPTYIFGYFQNLKCKFRKQTVGKWKFVFWKLDIGFAILSTSPVLYTQMKCIQNFKN
jgi:hypothetical protein